MRNWLWKRGLWPTSWWCVLAGHKMVYAEAGEEWNIEESWSECLRCGHIRHHMVKL